MKTVAKRARALGVRIAVVALVASAAVVVAAGPAAASYVTGDIASTAEAANGTNGGQCKAFVNSVVHTVTGVSLSGYQQGFANAGAVEITDRALAVRGDIIQITPAGSTDATAESMMGSTSSTRLHTTILRGPRQANGTFDVIDSNWGYQGPSGWVLDQMVQEHNFDPYTWAAGSIIKIWRFGTPAGGGGTTGNHVDLAWFQSNGHLYTFTGSGLGTTGDTSYYTPTWAGVGDYDKDGRSDLFLYDGPTDTIYWMSSDGQALGSHGIAAIRSGIGAPGWAAVGDFDHDGYRNDIAWFENGNIYTLLGSCGLCTAYTATGYYPPTWGGVGDYNHDGYDDLFLYDGPSRTIYWASSSAGSGVAVNGIGGLRTNVDAPGWAGVGDFTHDGYRDSIAWFANGNIYTFKGSGLSGTATATGYYPPTWGGVGDYNHDGYDDLILYDGPSSTILWTSSDGTGVALHGMAAIRGPGVGAPTWAGVGNFE